MDFLAVDIVEDEHVGLVTASGMRSWPVGSVQMWPVAGSQLAYNKKQDLSMLGQAGNSSTWLEILVGHQG